MDFQNSFTAGKRSKCPNKIRTILPTIPSVRYCTTLRKLEVRVLANLEENAHENVCNMYWFLNTHPIVMHLAYLLTYLLFQFPVPVKYSR